MTAELELEFEREILFILLFRLLDLIFLDQFIMESFNLQSSNCLQLPNLIIFLMNFRGENHFFIFVKGYDISLNVHNSIHIRFSLQAKYIMNY